MVILKRFFKILGFVCLTPFLIVAIMLSIFSLPFVYMVTGEAEMFNFFGKMIDLLGI